MLKHHKSWKKIILAVYMIVFCATSVSSAWTASPILTESEARKVTNAVIATSATLNTEDSNADILNAFKTLPSKYSDEDIELIARLAYAEAGNQCELGKRLVIDVILNRLDHENFPKTVKEVIHQTNQFSPAMSGSMYKYELNDDMVRLVREELNRRTDSDVIFFRANHYGKYGVPMYKVGGHYFSSYE